MIQPSWYPDDRQLRQFAVIALFGFGLAGALAYWRFGWEIAAYVLWAMAVITCLVGWVAPRAVLPIYAGLMLITLPIGWVVSHVFLYALFYLVVTPVGLVFRILGRDALGLRRPSTGSYWVAHEQRTDSLSYYRQS